MKIPPYMQPLSATDGEMARIGHVADLNRAWEKVLHRYAVKTVYPKDAVIPHQQSKGMYYLAQGSVGIFYTSSCGRERLTLCIEPGCLFNEARTLAGYNPEGRFVCTSETEVWRFTENLLEDVDFVREYPALISNLLRSMGVKMLIHYTFLADMGTGQHEVHLCRFILSMARKHNNSSTFPCGMTQQEVADLLGIHRATLARALQKLKHTGVISSFNAREVQISNWNLLLSLASQ